METITQTQERLKAFIVENYSTADIAPGSVLNELLLKAASTIHNQITNKDIQDLGRANSIAAVLASPTDTYSEIITNIAQDFNTYRHLGIKVTGLIKITVTENRNYFVEKGISLYQPQLLFTYITTQKYEILNYTGTTRSLSATQLQLFRGGNEYYFILPVEATGVGEEVDQNKNNTSVSSSTQFMLSDTAKIPNFVSATAYGNFSSGVNLETDKQLISRFKQGLSYGGLDSTKNLRYNLMLNYPELRALSVVGPNDEEMIRGKDNPWGISQLGMADMYLRTSTDLQTKKVVLTATLVANNSQFGASWNLVINPLDTTSLNYSEIPAGFYKIESISEDSTEVYTGSYVLSTITYGYDPDAINNNNQLTNAEYARFTKYQTAMVVFGTDMLLSGSPGLERTFAVTFLYSPKIAEIQDYINSDDNRLFASNYLVRAVLPCSVSVKLNVTKKTDSTISSDILKTQIKQAIYDYINGLNFGEPIIASKLIDIAHNYDISKVHMPITLHGDILYPSILGDSSLHITGVNNLSIPTDIAKGISPNTVCFYASYGINGDNISIEDV